jgi:two-component system CheB/CheR fusion protein
MKTYKDMTKEELIKALKELSSEQNIKQSAYEDTLHELETQNIELQESRKELEESSNRYALLYDFAPVGYCTLDKKGIIREINLTGAKMLGVERNRLAGMPFNLFVSEGDMEKFFSHLKKCKEQKEQIEKVSTELCLKEKNEQTAWIELLSSPMEGSEELMFQTVITDITWRKQADEALSFSETRYRRLFESAKDGILILSLETGKIIDVNQFLIDLLGYSKEQFIEKAIWEIGFFKDIIANKDKFLELQQMGFVRYENLPLETADGRKINVEFVSNVYLIGHYEVIQCNIRDITERKQAEEE